MVDRLAARPAAGRAAEALAAAHLEANGFRILARNWRRPEGELDIVAGDGETCVFVEVRSRTGGERGHPLEAVTPRKRAQVIRTARLYLGGEAQPAAAYRFDVIGVTFHADKPAELVHIRDAFQT